MIARKSVRCRLCYRCFKNLNIHLRCEHTMTCEMYLIMFSDANINSIAVSSFQNYALNLFEMKEFFLCDENEALEKCEIQ